jgi:hypothetical protein
MIAVDMGPFRGNRHNFPINDPTIRPITRIKRAPRPRSNYKEPTVFRGPGRFRSPGSGMRAAAYSDRYKIMLRHPSGSPPLPEHVSAQYSSRLDVAGSPLLLYRP